MAQLGPIGPAAIGAAGVDERAPYGRLMRRILPFLFVCYVIIYAIGLIRDRSGGFTAPLLAIGCTLLFGATLMVVFGRLARRETVPEALAA